MTRTTDFDREEIIDKAMHVFWDKGYEGTSLSDLIKATGLLKGSIYNSFKSKENLFLLCLDKYAANSRKRHYKGTEAREYLLSFYERLINEGVDKAFTKGCLVMNSCMEFADDNSGLAKKAKALFNSTEMNLENVAKEILGNHESQENIDRIKNGLVTAAFSIRKISKFKKDRKFLTQIANNALAELDLKL